jgi:ArsR family transcriptional regulator
MVGAQKIARVFKALSVDTRVRIVQLLKDRTLCVNALAKRLDVSAVAVSQHLRILRDADIVTGEKRGYYVHYRINPETLERWRELAEGLLSSRPGTPIDDEGGCR